MELGITLIDKAAAVCGSDSKLAERLGVHRVAVSEMRSGKRSITPATAAEMADIAGLDVDDAVRSAVLESVKGTRREGVLREILGKAIAAGAAGMLVTSYVPDSRADDLVTQAKQTKVSVPLLGIHRMK